MARTATRRWTGTRVALSALLLVHCGTDDGLLISTGSGVEWVVAHAGVPGVSIAVVRDFAIDYLEVHGVRNVETGEPVTPQTLFEAASISKTLTSVAALRLVQDGRLALDEDINLALTSWQIPDNEFTTVEKVTLRRLLAHTAGTRTGGAFYRYGEAVPTTLQILDGTPPAVTPAIVVGSVPGAEYRYSNPGFTVVQQALQDVAMASFPRLTRELVLDPLGMHDSTFEQPIPPERLDRASAGHDQGGGVLDGLHYIYPNMASGGLWATPEELALFLIELLSSLRGEPDTILSQSLAALMATPVLVDGYGLGLELFDIGGETYFGHSGGVEGFRSLMIGHPTGVGAVVMTNKTSTYWLTLDIVDIIGSREHWPGYEP